MIYTFTTKCVFKKLTKTIIVIVTHQKVVNNQFLSPKEIQVETLAIEHAQFVVKVFDKGL